MQKESTAEMEAPLSPLPRFAVVISPYYEKIVYSMLSGAKTYLQKHGITLDEKDIFKAPGSFEIPLLAKKLAKTGRYDGVICFGCVIKGETAHFDFICLGASLGIQMASLETEVPIAFGILTAYTVEQAEKRSANDEHNKGIEAAAACLESVRTLRAIAETN